MKKKQIKSLLQLTQLVKNKLTREQQSQIKGGAIVTETDIMDG